MLTNGLIGPPLGGLLFGVAMVVPFGIDAASFAAAAITMVLLSRNFAPSDGGGTDESMTHQIIEGFRWFWRRPVLRNLALISTALGTALFIGAAVFVLLATQTLHLSATGYGLLLVPAAIGGIAGSLRTQTDQQLLTSGTGNVGDVLGYRHLDHIGNLDSCARRRARRHLAPSCERRQPITKRGGKSSILELDLNVIQQALDTWKREAPSS